MDIPIQDAPLSFVAHYKGYFEAEQEPASAETLHLLSVLLGIVIPTLIEKTFEPVQLVDSSPGWKKEAMPLVLWLYGLRCFLP